eukprot:m.178729 g.178729  ORF g.178729 m.178729 type:complete len:96 (-) comp31953_c0_seq1:143-430(-)
MATSQPSTTKIGDVQYQMDEVVTVMHDNIHKVLEREMRLVNLEEKSEGLKHSSIQFHTTTKKLKRTMWWKNVRWIVGIVFVAVVVVGVIVLVALL